MKSLKWMIYGANGFSGTLIAREAVRRQLTPILAGRDKKAIPSLAKELNLEYRIFDLDEFHKLQGIKLLLNCAGPFKSTAQVLAKSCITSGVHYLDLSGEWFTFQSLFELSNAAKEKHIILLPGVGLFITATDCLISLLKEELPDAEYINLFFIVDSKFRFNKGSIKSILELLNKTLRQENTNFFYSLAFKKITVKNQQINAISLPLPDLFTGNISTEISDIRIYGHFRRFSFLLNKLPCLLSNSMIMYNFSILKTFAYNVIDLLPYSKVDINHINSGVLLHGIACNKDGVLVEKAFEIDNPYIFTQKSTLFAIQRILEKPYFDNFGFQTPSLIFGKQFLFEILENID